MIIICEFCKKSINRIPSRIKRAKKHFCSIKCTLAYRSFGSVVNCKHCGISFYKNPSQIKKTKNNFCCQSHAAIYNNAHKKYGTRKSKLEYFIEQELIKVFPNLQIITNSKELIGSELDLYFPSIDLAIEINGIFHYEPIFGKHKLTQIQ